MNTITKTWTDGAFTVTWYADEDGCGYGKLTATVDTQESLFKYFESNPDDMRYGFYADVLEAMNSDMKEYEGEVPLWGGHPNVCFVDGEQHYLVQFTDYAVRFEVEDVIREGCTPIYVSTYTPVDDEPVNEYDV